MNNSLLKFYLLSILMFLFMACSDTQVAGGTGTETTNGIVILSSNNSLVSARIVAIEKSNWLNSSLNNDFSQNKVLQSDLDGITILYDLDSINSHYLYITCDSLGESIILKDYRNQDTVVLQKNTFIRGANSSANRVAVLGTDIVQQIDSAGNFQLSNIPPGTHDLVFFNQTDVVYNTRVATSDDSTYDFSENQEHQVLLNDFNYGIKKSPLELYGFVNVFYEFKNDSSIIDRSTYCNNDSCDYTLDNSEESDGYMHVVSNLSQQDDAGAWAGTGFYCVSFDSVFSYMNAEDLDSVKIVARGQGILRLSLETSGIEHYNDSNTIIDFYSANINLNTEWTEHIISVNDFHLHENDSIFIPQFPLVSELNELIRIEFIFSSGDSNTESDYWFDIDELSFFGVHKLF